MGRTDFIDSGSAELCVEGIGDRSQPAVLLIAGGASSMDRWEPAFCERLAAEGRFVIRYDHRDTGQSTMSPPGSPDYSGDDLAGDALAVLGHFGVEQAHLVGISMGGGIAQWLAVEHPERVLSLTLMSTSPAAARAGEHPELPGMSDALAASFAGDEGDQGDDPDEGGDGDDGDDVSDHADAPPDLDREAAIAALLEEERPYAGSRGVDEAELREVIGRTCDRSERMDSAANHFLIGGSPLPRGSLAELTVPALVIHGTDDPLFPPAHGEALAAELPGARLLLLAGLGHEFPRSAWDAVLPGIVALTTA